MNLNLTSVFCLFFAVLLIFACSHRLNPLSPEHLAGEYDLVSYTDKRVGVFYESGVPTKNGSGVLTSFRGSLILTQTEFQILRVITFHRKNTEPEIFNESVHGDYFIENEIFVVVEKESGQSDFIPIKVVDDLLILEDSDFKFVYQRS